MEKTFQTEQINSLHRYYIWANKMREHFKAVFSQQGEGTKSFQIESMMYMSIWYGLMYVVIEGWQELKLSDNKLDNLLNEAEKVDLLRRYRNGAFHYQKIYDDDRFEKFFQKTTTVNWICSLNEEFGRWFLENPTKIS